VLSITVWWSHSNWFGLVLGIILVKWDNICKRPKLSFDFFSTSMGSFPEAKSHNIVKRPNRCISLRLRSYLENICITLPTISARWRGTHYKWTTTTLNCFGDGNIIPLANEKLRCKQYSYSWFSWWVYDEGLLLEMLGTATQQKQVQAPWVGWWRGAG